MSNPKERTTARKIQGATAAQARRASGHDDAAAAPKNSRTAKATKAAGCTRDVASIAARRVGADASLQKTIKLLDVGASDTLQALYRCAMLDYLHLATKEKTLVDFYAHLARMRSTELKTKGEKQPNVCLLLTDVEQRQLAEQIRQFSTGKNRALQTALSAQKQHADQNLANVPQRVIFHFGEAESMESAFAAKAEEEAAAKANSRLSAPAARP